MIVRYLDSLNIGKPGREMIGCSGTFGLCIFRSPLHHWVRFSSMCDLQPN